MPRGYEHTWFPTIHLPPIVPVPGGRDDIQHSMTLSLHNQCTSSQAFVHCIKVWVTIVWGSFPLTSTSDRGSGVGLGSRGLSSPSLGSENCVTLLLGSHLTLDAILLNN